MANKSALKNVKQSRKRRLRNISVKSNIKTVTKKVEQAAAGGQVVQAQETLARAVSAVDKAASKGVIHKNKAARKVSRLTRIINKMPTPSGTP